MSIIGYTNICFLLKQIVYKLTYIKNKRIYFTMLIMKFLFIGSTTLLFLCIYIYIYIYMYVCLYIDAAKQYAELFICVYLCRRLYTRTQFIYIYIYVVFRRI